MIKTVTISQAKPILGKLLDLAGSGQPVYLRRKEHLYRIEPVAEVDPIPSRPFGFFAIEEGDPMITLANSAQANFTPPK